jgi:hypothetical protein
MTVSVIDVIQESGQCRKMNAVRRLCGTRSFKRLPEQCSTQEHNASCSNNQTRASRPANCTRTVQPLLQRMDRSQPRTKVTRIHPLHYQALAQVALVQCLLAASASATPQNQQSLLSPTFSRCCCLAALPCKPCPCLSTLRQRQTQQPERKASAQCLLPCQTYTLGRQGVCGLAGTPRASALAPPTTHHSLQHCPGRDPRSTSRAKDTTPHHPTQPNSQCHNSSRRSADTDAAATLRLQLSHSYTIRPTPASLHCLHCCC